MSTKSIKAGYLTTAWDEKTISAEDATIKITRVRSERKFTGAMEGAGKQQTRLVLCFMWLTSSFSSRR
ncbi:hypothetical protein FRC08_015415 [Ceratobasidium sp. 394]|nr:hypothetical protein FRC08_015415 [Ceratobasidium sp. 394]